jgi:hypothetical protein
MRLSEGLTTNNLENTKNNSKSDNPAQKLSPPISAQLVVGREVFGRDEDGRAS